MKQFLRLELKASNLTKISIKKYTSNHSKMYIFVKLIQFESTGARHLLPMNLKNNA